MTRAGIWVAAASIVCAASVAFAEEKTEAAAEEQSQVEAAPEAPEATEAQPATETKSEEAQAPQQAARRAAEIPWLLSRHAERTEAHAGLATLRRRFDLLSLVGRSVHAGTPSATCAPSPICDSTISA